MQRTGMSSNTGLIDVDESLYDVPVLFSDHSSASQAEISIKPCMPQSASIRLDTNLDESIALLLADGFDAQTGRVSMSADHRDRIARLPLLPNGKGNDCRGIPGENVFAARNTAGRP
jgi:hypothetical protein